MALPDAPPAGLDLTSHALQQMDATLHIHTSQFEKVLQAILDTKNSFEAKIDAVTLDVNLLRADHRTLSGRVAETKTEVAEMRPTMKELQERMNHLSTEVTTLKLRAEDAKGRSRCNNICMEMWNCS
ncbi:hypothetical protein NDU88_003107 [Pleurodeles waltl]|uniref:Uncharacterized protein n=1 Tax=Pleurodeles waltl TaxID=8319 RepID=A0AAV7TNP8_PLEWA|nr:hypothetical protein NDU88_003107 [Pleurodeles waltl]